MLDSEYIERLCSEKGLKMTEQRRVIARVLSESEDHPDVEVLYQRAMTVDPKISIATVYRTVRLFEEASILDRHDFGDGRSRYEESSEQHHDHLIDIESGEVIEFTNDEIEALQCEVARCLGYKLVDHKLELYAVPLGRDKDAK
jgi:Fur family ferric uptake transcriptional regulator